jgi:LacI family transcriptional regulator
MTTRGRPVVGVRLPPWATFAGSIYVGLLEYMRRHGFWELVTGNDAFGELEPIRLDRRWTGDGIIAFRMTQKEATAWKRAGMAVVNISSEGGAYGFPRVIPDNHQVGRVAADHLISLGLSNFAYVGRAASLYNVESWLSGPRRYARERWKGFSSALEARDLTAHSFFLPAHPLWKKNTWRVIRRQLAAFVSSLPIPCGIFAADDPLALVVRHACTAAGRSVPDDISLLGFGNDHVYCHGTTPALTSVEYPGREIGLRAAELLAAQLRDVAPREAEELVHVGVVVPRESTNFLAFNDLEVARLIRWIRLQAITDPIQVTDVVAQSSLSLTALKERFQSALGHGPKREIMLTRQRHLEFLLQTTDLPLEKIAASMRFPSVESMSRFLVRLNNRRPEDFRAPSPEQTVAQRSSGGFIGHPAKAAVAARRRSR